MIFLNGELFIAEAIDSILRQTMTDWELILVDDGTTDGATAIARSYAELHPNRISYTEHPGHDNRGMSASRNRGIAEARGAYVAFLDADDIWLPTRLERHCEMLDANPNAALVAGPNLLWRSWMPLTDARKNREARVDIPCNCQLPIGRLIPPPEAAIRFLESHGTALPGICSVTFHREAALAVGGFNESFRTLYEDQVFLFRLCTAFPAWATDELLDYYRQHPQSACHQEGELVGDVRMRPVFLTWLQEHLIDIGCKDERLWKAYRTEMLRFDHPTFWSWMKLHERARGWWNFNSRRAMIFVLTPRLYNWLRKAFGLSHVDPAAIG